ncbi:PIN domain-containing protein [Nocardia sp. CDC159]|uniref:Ribonuclease VapC n=1 Tax=Nocardia pulmonis TaxID=2951408 RepID=A0A9X2J110_9NOCA|nr:PIN domain-containing protein [Nocardia pulmonis]MCM6788925.1 PIN domain-containing protein [Nocardia sp. CDC159]
MISLLDANVLIALTVDEHLHHDAAESWFSGTAERFATCPITQGSLVRFLMRQGHSARSALTGLAYLTAHDKHEFWPDEVPFAQVRMDSVMGHRQVTDAYLAQLARWRKGRVATFDKGLAAAHSDVVDLIDP